MFLENFFSIEHYTLTCTFSCCFGSKHIFSLHTQYYVVYIVELHGFILMEVKSKIDRCIYFIAGRMVNARCIFTLCACNLVIYQATFFACSNIRKSQKIDLMIHVSHTQFRLTQRVWMLRWCAALSYISSTQFTLREPGTDHHH